MSTVGAMCLVAVFLVIGVGEVGAQNSLRLYETGTNRDEVQLQIGQPVTVEVLADLGDVAASGISVFITIPAGDFVVVDQRPVDVAADADPSDQANVGTQPFTTGPLFEGAAEMRNLLNSTDELEADGLRLIEYQVVFGPGDDRSTSGTGVVATFQLLPIRAVENSAVSVVDNPLYETRVILGAGGERRFESTPGGMQISVLAQATTALTQESWASVKAAGEGP